MLDILTTLDNKLISSETKRVCSQNRRHFSNFCFPKFQEVVLKIKSLKMPPVTKVSSSDFFLANLTCCSHLLKTMSRALNGKVALHRKKFANNKSPKSYSLYNYPFTFQVWAYEIVLSVSGWVASRASTT
uniref:Uncharacterized protein n=1 Tax=Cucumis melo TaxID=3656 RepID=A0A9I9ED72_CUCME